MQMTDLLDEARRQSEICNACRYCEGYCAVFPALHRERSFAAADLTHFANLCHNCRGCYYACQYTAPHEFDLNLPKALAEVRQASWQEHAWPRPLAEVFHRSGVALVAALTVGFAILLLLMQRAGAGEGFYAVMSHSAMVALFAPAFVLPLVALFVSVRRYWHTAGGGIVRWAHVVAALRTAGEMRNLKGGHGDGCNFEDGDRFTHGRRHAHQSVMYGFLLCFLSTSSGTVLHYGFGLEAPYGFWSVPKMLGVPGGLLMVVGCLLLMRLKLRADPELGAQRVWGGEMGFVALLGFVALSGLALYALGRTGVMPLMLVLHLGAVLTLFVLTPYTKMVHGAYRLAALIQEEGRRAR